MTPKIGSFAVALAILFACSAAFGQTETEKIRSQPHGPSADPATTAALKPSIQFDAKGVEFGPWLRRWFGQVKQNWIVPGGVGSERGAVEATFYVKRDGTITEARMTRSSGIPRFDRAALDALIRSSPAQPLPAEYPDDRAFFTVTFYYNPGPQNPTPVPTAPSQPPIIDNPRSLRDPAPALEVFTIDGGTIYHRGNCISLVGHRRVKVADRSQTNRDIRTTCWICQPDGPR